jgi:glycosyltransferase involved in cell wall biosynthesis
MPEFDRESGSRRIYHLIKLLRETGWSVSLFAENMTGGERYARILRQEGIMVYGGIHSRGISDAYLPNPKVLLENGHFDLVLVAFWYFAEQLMPIIRATSPLTRIIVDSIDVHFLRQARKTFHREDRQQPVKALTMDYASEMIRELNTYAAADGVFTVSQKEADLINDFVAQPNLAHAVPDMEELELSPNSFEERKGILFVGNFRHEPNMEAIGYLFKHIVPRLDPAVLAQHPLLVVGNAMTEEIRRLGDDWPHVKMVGWVPSVIPYFNRARVSIVPLLHGAGTKRKVIESLSIGTPCVSTSIGAEGLALEHGKEIWVADDADAFATATERLLVDVDLWHHLREHGRARITATHGRQVVCDSLYAALAHVMDHPPLDPAPSKTLPWLTHEWTGRVQRARVGVKNILRTVRDQLK